jgi:hypothetical protein
MNFEHYSAGQGSFTRYRAYDVVSSTQVSSSNIIHSTSSGGFYGRAIYLNN